MNAQNEEWKPIPGMNGEYEVSDQGHVRSLKSGKVHILTPKMNNSGYFRVAITLNGIRCRKYIHHLVALAYIGERPAKHDVNHINGVKTDNRPENLNYLTRAENMKHAREHGLHDNRGERAYNAKLTGDDALLIHRGYFIAGLTAAQMAESLGVSERTVSDVLRRATWKHIYPDV